MSNLLKSSPVNAISEKTATKVPARLVDYLAMLRPDYWLKNIFILPGVLFALAFYHGVVHGSLLYNVIAGLISACLVASANYVINEYLDAEFDKFHPLKKNRTSVVRVVNPVWVYSGYVVLAIVGLALAYSISLNFLATSIFLLFMGLVYNVRPLRTKERVYVDVLSESVNNPIRFALGWFMVAPVLSMGSGEWWLINFIDTMPPLSIVVAYWMGGAFLMATKRFAEYRLINNPETAGLYRKSFKFYTENSLLISMFFYAITCAFFMGIFLIKNRIEMLVSFPFFALLFAWYLKIGLLKDSPVQGSEKLWTRKYFMTYVVLFSILLIVLMFVDIPFLRLFLIKAYE